MRYREHFHITWQEFLATPWQVVQHDLEILSLEREIKAKKAPKR